MPNICKSEEKDPDSHTETAPSLPHTNTEQIDDLPKKRVEEIFTAITYGG